MKLGFVGFILGGLIVLLTLFDSSFAPWPIKLFIGIGLLLYGLNGLLQSRIKEGNKVILKWALPSMLILTSFGTGVFYYLNSNASNNSPVKLKGTFEISFLGRNHPGTAILDGDKLTLQFRVPSSSTEIKGITLSKTNKIYKEPIEWICAQKKDFNVVHCTTSPNALTNFQEQFYDNGFFTITFDFKSPLEVENIEHISFVVHTDTGDKKILINTAQK